MNDDSTPIAFFDFDGTLTKRDTLMPYLKYTLGPLLYYWNLLKVSPTLLAAFFRVISRDNAKRKLLKVCLAGLSEVFLYDKGKGFSLEIDSKMLRSDMMESLRKHQKKNHFCVIVSASLPYYLEPWCSMHNIDFLISTKLDSLNGVCGGDIFHKNCRGEEKVARIMEIFPDLKKRKSFAYGNSKDDIPMINIASKGYMI
ncbi:HAD-IB family hydrolase [uncultured Halovibrio sp.]|uniref:HAD-IB family hydrolase n=1 Tax=uncultured Halovibrio sp. TaxID=985049 RepID=UPI0025EF844C|nr:HAD-IB family hydrolase [uncultured Halovibrio sp.]